MKIDKATKISCTTSAMETSVGTEIVLMVLESGNVYGLGETGSAVWRLLAQSTTVETVVRALVIEYDASPEVIESDVIELLEQMHQQGLITVTSVD